MSDPVSPFHAVVGELARLGITLTWLPGEYFVNFRNGAESTARAVETLAEALTAGRALAAERAAAPPNGEGPRRRRRLRMTPKAIRGRRPGARSSRSSAPGCTTASITPSRITGGDCSHDRGHEHRSVRTFRRIPDQHVHAVAIIPHTIRQGHGLIGTLERGTIAFRTLRPILL
jgi:hypothetical protein